METALFLLEGRHRRPVDFRSEWEWIGSVTSQSYSPSVSVMNLLSYRLVNHSQPFTVNRDGLFKLICSQNLEIGANYFKCIKSASMRRSLAYALALLENTNQVKWQASEILYSLGQKECYMILNMKYPNLLLSRIRIFPATFFTINNCSANLVLE